MKKEGKYYTILHLIILVALNFILIFLYNKWPWRGWIDNIIWKYPDFFINLAIFEFRYNLIGILFLIPIIYGTLSLWWKGTFIALVLALPALINLWQMWNYTPSLFLNVSIFFVPILLTIAIRLEQIRRTHERQMVVEREKERQKLVKLIIDAQETERKRIAHELHDDIMQTLSVIASRLENIPRNNFNESEIHKTTEIILNTINNLRHICRNLIPTTLERLGLLSALRLLIDNANKQYTCQFKLIVLGQERRLPSNIEINIFRIVQEALNNIGRHSEASNAWIELSFQDKHLFITIKDNGKGFDIPQSVEEILTRFIAQNKLGLIGMIERINLIGGTIQFTSAPSQGTLTSIKIPYND